jgi:hypothetical protein
VTIQEFLAAQGLTPGEIEAVVGNEKQAKAMSAAIAKFDEGSQALTRAEAEKQETANFWEQKTQELQGSVTRLTTAEKRAAQAEADSASRKAYLKSLADQGYDVPKEMYDGAPAATTTTTTTGNQFTREEAMKMMRGTAPDLVSLTALSNEYYDLFGSPYVAVEQDFAEAQKSGKPLRDYARSKYNFDGKRNEKTQAADQKRIDDIVSERMKTKEAELAAKYGSNPDTRTPMPSKFDRLTKSPGFKGDSWKSQEGRDANRQDRLKKFENVSIQ